MTHPNVTRYFMSIPEASQLVLQAAAMGERGRVYVLDMGKPVRIMASRATSSGYRASTKKRYVSNTPACGRGRVFEEVIDTEERLIDTPHPKLQIAAARVVPTRHVVTVMQEITATGAVSDAVAREALTRWVPEFASVASDANGQVLPEPPNTGTAYFISGIGVTSRTC